MQVNQKRTDNKSKKSKTIIVASIVLMLCLITTCVVGTTLAKYTTSGSGNDSAQVAKWGVKIAISGASDMFKNEYDNVKAATVAGTARDVVAPGTSGSMSFSISGTPEVKLHLDFALTGVVDSEVKEVFLKAGNYSESGYSNITSDYYPVKFTLKKNGADAESDEVVTYTKDEESKTAENISLKEMVDALNSLDKDYDPNTDLAATYTLSWKWAYEGGNDAADTLLGDIIAGAVTVDSSKYNTEVEFKLAITATQID